jgi:hypothetical protein
VPTVNSLTLAEWVAEFERLKKVNAEVMGCKGEKPAPKRKQQDQAVRFLASLGIRCSYGII